MLKRIINYISLIRRKSLVEDWKNSYETDHKYIGGEISLLEEEIEVLEGELSAFSVSAVREFEKQKQYLNSPNKPNIEDVVDRLAIHQNIHLHLLTNQRFKNTIPELLTGYFELWKKHEELINDYMTRDEISGD